MTVNELPNIPKRQNPYADLSREELERRLWLAEVERSSLKFRLTTAEERLATVCTAFRVLREVDEEERST